MSDQSGRDWVWTGWPDGASCSGIMITMQLIVGLLGCGHRPPLHIMITMQLIVGLLGCGHMPSLHKRPRHGTVFSVAGKTAAAACGEPRCGVAKCGRGTKHPLCRSDASRRKTWHQLHHPLRWVATPCGRKSTLRRSSSWQGDDNNLAGWERFDDAKHGVAPAWLQGLLAVEVLQRLQEDEDRLGSFSSVKRTSRRRQLPWWALLHSKTVTCSGDALRPAPVVLPGGSARTARRGMLCKEGKAVWWGDGRRSSRARGAPGACPFIGVRRAW
jgi:hypothetical protein